MAGQVVEEGVVAAAEFAQEPVVGFRAQGRRAAEEQALEDRQARCSQDALLVGVAVELRHAFEQRPEEQQSLWITVGVLMEPRYFFFYLSRQSPAGA